MFKKKEVNDDGFSSYDRKMLENFNNIIKNQILEINKLITLILTQYSKGVQSSDNKIMQNRSINWGDYKVLYDNILNVIVLKYVTTMEGINEYYLNNDFKLLINSDKENNPYVTNLMPRLAYDTYNICQIIDTAVFNDDMIRIDECISKIQVCNIKIVEVEIKSYLSKIDNKIMYLNDYYMMVNNQIQNTIKIILIVSDQLKAEYFNKVVFKNYEEMEKLK